MKILRKTDLIRLKQVEHVISEREILIQLRHPFVVRLYRTFMDNVNLYMLMEFVVGGELFTHLRRAGRFSNDVTRFFVCEVLIAIEYMHTFDIIYRDLKPENILLDITGHIKITDFGFAKVVKDRTWTLCGTPEYLAPEIIQSKGHGKAVDWWALGILMFEMLAGFPPFYDEHPFGIYEKILGGKLTFPMHFDVNAKDLVKKLLTQDRSRRIGSLLGGANDIKDHKWFKDISWDDVVQLKLTPPIQVIAKHLGDSSNFDEYPEEQYNQSMPTDNFNELFPNF